MAKRILLLAPLNELEFITNYDRLKESLEQTNRAVYFSPMFFVAKDVEKSFTLQILSAAIAVDKTIDDFNDLIKENVEVLVYFGPAPKKLEFDHIYTIKEDVLSAQESFYDHSIAPKMVQQLDFYRTEDTEKSFDSVEDFLYFLKEEYNV
ncbi:MAG: hypothetical protein ACOCRO_05540 [Halanaerobiales bacterium]